MGESKKFRRPVFFRLASPFSTRTAASGSLMANSSSSPAGCGASGGGGAAGVAGAAGDLGGDGAGDTGVTGTAGVAGVTGDDCAARGEGRDETHWGRVQKWKGGA